MKSADKERVSRQRSVYCCSLIGKKENNDGLVNNGNIISRRGLLLKVKSSYFCGGGIYSFEKDRVTSMN